MNDRRSDDEVLRDAYSPEYFEKRAPVQGYKPGIPWALHLEAYGVYKKLWGGQPAMLDLAGRGCRGGFTTGELDEWIPGWRQRLTREAPEDAGLGGPPYPSDYERGAK